MTLKNFTGGIICIILGLVLLRLVLKHPTKDNGALANNFGLYVSGICFIIIGVMLLLGKLK